MSMAQSGFNCGACKAQIRKAVRFVCLVCENFILCEVCRRQKRSSGEHRATHPMQKVLPMNLLLTRGTIVKLVQHLCCPYCGDKEFNEFELKDHCRKYHATKDGPIRCPICVVYSVTPDVEPRNLLKHLIQHCAGKDCSLCPYMGFSTWYVCLECKDTYVCIKCRDRKLETSTHKPYHPVQFVRYSIDDSLNIRNFDSWQNFKCPHCEDTEFTVPGLIEHCQKYHCTADLNKVQCPVCSVLRVPEKQLEEESLLEHLQECHVVSGETAECSNSTSESRVCTICMEEIGNASTVQTLRCGHGFHGACITSWMRNNNTCPICRTEHSK